MSYIILSRKFDPLILWVEIKHINENHLKGSFDCQPYSLFIQFSTMNFGHYRFVWEIRDKKKYLGLISSLCIPIPDS